MNLPPKYARILVPLDGSEIAESILPWVSALAKGIEAELVLMTVADEVDGSLRGLIRTGGIATRDSIDSEVNEDFRQEFEPVLVERSVKRAEKWLDETRNRLEADGLRVTSAIATGDPAEEIIRTARQKGCDLIAIGTRGRSAIGRGILGSTTDRVVHSSDVPMLIVRSGASTNALDRSMVRFPSVIIVGLDGSRLAEAILGPAGSLAAQVKADIRLVKAFPRSRNRLSGGAARGGAERTRHSLEAESQNYLEIQAAKLRQAGLSVSVEASSGPAESVLLRISRRWPGSLLVVGTRGLSGLSRWVLGSVTDRTIRSASGPVLVIPPRLGGSSS